MSDCFLGKNWEMCPNIENIEKTKCFRCSHILSLFIRGKESPCLTCGKEFQNFKNFVKPNPKQLTR